MMQDNATCKVLCTETVPPSDDKFINDRIREDYAINWLVDGLPAAETKVDRKTGEVFFDMGFNLGYDEGEFKEMPALHNHYNIELRSVDVLRIPYRHVNEHSMSRRYHSPTSASDVHRIVGVTVWPTR